MALLQVPARQWISTFFPAANDFSTKSNIGVKYLRYLVTCYNYDNLPICTHAYFSGAVLEIGSRKCNPIGNLWYVKCGS